MVSDMLFILFSKCHRQNDKHKIPFILLWRVNIQYPMCKHYFHPKRCVGHDQVGALLLNYTKINKRTCVCVFNRRYCSRQIMMIRQKFCWIKSRAFISITFLLLIYPCECRQVRHFDLPRNCEQNIRYDMSTTTTTT